MENKPKLKLTGTDGNAYAILGACMTAAKNAGWTKEEWATVREVMMSGNYDHLLATACEYFEIS